MPMEAKDIFEANSRNVREMLSERGLGLYIPPYQRPYGWDKDKVNKLLEDTLHGYTLLVENPESFTFLGTVITIHDINFTTVQPIVRPDVPAKVLTVIDGQQRLTSLLLLCLALHNQIRLAHTKMLKGRAQGSLRPAESWLHGQTLRIIEELASTFHEKQAYGDAPPYPRMIRSFDDQWCRNIQHAKYKSPVANLIAAYSAICGQEKPSEFKPKKRDGQIEGEEALIERYAQIVKALKAIYAGNRKQELEELPTVAEILASPDFQRALINHDFPDEVIAEMRSDSASEEFSGLIQLLLVSCYVLNRVALTVVRGKNEDYAFTVFESLNTTGEPLTAFETFKPRVVSAEGLEHYEASPSRQNLDQVSNYLSEFKVGERLQAATRDLLIIFASAETGAKLSKRLADQRRYLKDEFERYESDQAKRLSFIRNLRDVATFVQHSWDFEGSPSLNGLPVDATTDAVKLCLTFLADLGHSITIAPLVRFYSAALAADEEERLQKIKEFEAALKAITAFSALWRASRRTTANIDQEYREILTGGNLTGLGALARSLKKGLSGSTVLDLDGLKAELRARLTHKDHGAIPDKSSFINDASSLPAYSISRIVARFTLLAAYHDAIEDKDELGLIVKGKSGVSPCLTFQGFREEKHLSLEHIAPHRQATGWPDVWSKNKEVADQIGNLVLVQQEANSSFSNRPWAEKRVLYGALSAASHTEAEKYLATSGIDFGDRAQQIAKESAHMPHLAALSTFAGEWTEEFIAQRSERLLGLAWDQLHPWLE